MNLWDKIADWYQKSVFHELFKHFAEDVFGVNFGSYERIPVGENAEAVARAMILALLAGVLVAAGAAVYTKAVPGGFIRKLLKMGATDPDHAVTLAETGYFRSFGVRADLKRGGTLAKLVSRPGDGELTVAGTRQEPEPDEERPTLEERLAAPDRKRTETEAEAKTEKGPETGGEGDKKEEEEEARTPEPVNFLTDRFYVPESLRIRAELRFEKAGSGARGFLLTVVLAVGAAILLCRLLPTLFSLADRILTNI